MDHAIAEAKARARLPHPSKRNRPGTVIETSAPVLCDKPDLRKWNGRKWTPAKDAAERARRAIRRRSGERPHETRWRTVGPATKSRASVASGHSGGYAHRTGDVTRHYRTCEYCRRWFYVEREGRGRAQWPLYCSESHRDIAAGVRDRRRAPRPAQAVSAPERVTVEFEPKGMDYADAVDLAEAIVEEQVPATPAVFDRAVVFLQGYEAGSSSVMPVVPVAQARGGK